MDEETLRRLAIWRFERGDPPGQIWPSLGRSRSWFFKWLARYRAEGSAALAGRSRAHRTDPHATPVEVRTRVREMRQAHPRWGERTIARELAGPSHATIGRILRVSGQTRPRRERLVPPVRYPRVVPSAALELVEYDFFGPRWISGFGRVMGLHAMDVFSRSVYLGAARDRQQTSQLGYWIGLLQRFGIPKIVQTDNEFGISANLRRNHPLFTRLTRFFLHIGIEHRFIPLGEPYRNGHIERFNRTYRYDFYDQEVFRDLAHLLVRQRDFARYFNEERIHGGIGYTVPASRFPLERPRLPADFAIDLDRLRLVEGRVSYVRRVDSEGVIRILNDQPVHLDGSLAGDYVTAVVHTPELDLMVLTVDGETVPTRRLRSPR